MPDLMMRAELFSLVNLRLETILDALRHSPQLREFTGWGYLLRAVVQKSKRATVSLACRALELAENDQLEAIARKRLSSSMPHSDLWREVVANLPRYRQLVPKQPSLTRSIVLKRPSTGEKGVLLLYFEYNWARLFLQLSVDEVAWLEDHYDLILAASWSPTDYAALALATSIWRGTIWIQPANYEEAGKIAAFHPRLRVLDSLACDWVNPDFYRPRPFAERSIDLIMIANWGGFKRHWEFFEALAKMTTSLRVVLIGQREGGRTMETIRSLAAKLKVPQTLEFYESLPIDQVTAMQCDAKVSVLMSRREGGCVAVVESLFAGCALALRRDAHVGSLAHINDQTGALLRPGHIAADLTSLLARAAVLQPRKWATDHVSCLKTTAKLNATLSQHHQAEGTPWTRDLVVANWRPHPTFARKADQLEMVPAYEELHRRFPSVFPADLWRESWR